MNTHNAIGIAAAFLLVIVATMSVSFRMLSPNLALFLLSASLGAAILGTIAGIRGNKWWFAETVAGLLMAALVLFALVGG